jgi:sugar phosphate isomerase/epimerase
VDPLLLVREAGERLESLHVRNSRKGIELEEVADGDINVPAIARALRQMFYDGFLVVELVYDKETQRTHPLPVALSRSRYYMQKVFGTRPGNPPVNMGPHVRTGG